MKEILQKADASGYGVGAYNLLSMEAVKGAVCACETLQSPLILQIAEAQLETAPLNLMIPMMVQAAKDAYIPIAVHLDHGTTFKCIKTALALGCTSVMYDGAALPFDENIAKTKQAVKLAHDMGATCEAELGVVGGSESGNLHTAKELMTNVDQVYEFVERTGCDALAIAIGNAHGPYVGEPNLNFERLAEINKAVGVPLVLHGGSGISDEDFRKCVQLGICKINVGTSLQQNVARKVKSLCCAAGANDVSFLDISVLSEAGVFEEILAFTEIFGSGGKALNA